jgi:RecA-family ATPase
MDDGVITLEEARQREAEGRRGPGAKSRAAQPLPRIADGSADRWLGKEPAPLEFTIEDLVPESMVTLFVADGGAGKSLLAQLAVACFPTGKSFLGKATKPGAAVGIFAEDPDQVLHIRQVRINKILDIKMEDLATACFPASFSRHDATLWRNEEPTPLLRDLEDQLRAIKSLRLLVLDNAALLFHGNENDRVEVTAFIRALTGMAERLEIGILLTAHTSKSSDDSVAKTGSGSTAWVFACRSVLKLESDGDEATLTLVKANHIRPGLEIPLEWQDGVLVAKAPVDSLEDRARKRQIDRMIFERVEQAWAANWPLSATAQTGDRYLPKALAKRGGFKAKEIKAAMHLHLEAGNLQQDKLPKKGLTGLRVERKPQGLKSYE